MDLLQHMSSEERGASFSMTDAEEERIADIDSVLVQISYYEEVGTAQLFGIDLSCLTLCALIWSNRQ